MSRSFKSLDVATTLLFVGALLTPLVDQTLNPDRVWRVRMEDREPAPRPSWSWQARTVEQFPKRFEAWYADALGLRDTLLAWRSRLLVFGFDISPTSLMVVGKERWLYYTELRSFDSYRGLYPMSMTDLRGWTRSFESRRAWCAARKIPYVLAFAPNKMVPYPERVPECYSRLGPSRLEQFMRWTRAHSELGVLDLGPSQLAEARADLPDDPAWFPLGTHWTDRGMYAGYLELLGALQQHLPSLEPVPRARLEFQPNDDQGDSFAQQFFIEESLRQSFRELVPPRDRTWKVEKLIEDGRGANIRTFNERGDLPRLAVVHDSFGEAPRNLLPYHFSKCLFMWEHTWPDEELERFQPDAVLQIFTERVLAMRPFPQLGGFAESDDEQRFAALPVQLCALDPKAEPAELVAVQNAALERVPGGLALGSGMFRLPRFQYPRAGVIALRLEIESDVKTELEIVFTTLREPEFSRGNLLRSRLQKGLNELHFDLVEPDLNGPLFLRLGRGGGRFIVRAFEARAEQN